MKVYDRIDGVVGHAYNGTQPPVDPEAEAITDARFRANRGRWR